MLKNNIFFKQNMYIPGFDFSDIVLIARPKLKS